MQFKRDQYIENLSKAIVATMKSKPQEDEKQLHKLPSKMLARQLFVQTQLNSTSTDLAFRRQIIPATRGTTKKVVYGL